MNDDLWKALADASDGLDDAMSRYSSDRTPQTRTRVEDAIREYMTRLGPIIGQVAAFDFLASFQTWVDLNDRLTRLIATFAGQPCIDAADAELLEQLQSETERARRAFEATEVTTRARLAQAERRG